MSNDKIIIVSPFSQTLRNGKPNPKSPPVDWWKEVITLLRKNNIKTIQVGLKGESEIGADMGLVNLSLKKLKELIMDVSTWVSVDNFMNHLANSIGKRGVCVFSRSDPKIYGYTQNINLLKDRSYLRPDQFNIWEQCEFVEDAFIAPDAVVSSIMGILK